MRECALEKHKGLQLFFVRTHNLEGCPLDICHCLIFKQLLTVSVCEEMKNGASRNEHNVKKEATQKIKIKNTANCENLTT